MLVQPQLFPITKKFLAVLGMQNDSVWVQKIKYMHLSL